VSEAGRSELDFLTNEPLEGELLAVRLTRGLLPEEEALRYAIDLGAALHRAHAAGLIHSRLSPHSILITGATARLLHPPGVLEAGEAPYRSPEQVRGEEPDSRSDIFSYGAVLYEMVSGRCAFPETGDELDQAILQRPPAALNGKSPLHLAMEGVVAGCMEKDPATRRQRIQNVVTELKLMSRSPRLPPAVRDREPGSTKSLLPTGAGAKLLPLTGDLAAQVNQPVIGLPQTAQLHPLPRARFGWPFWLVAIVMIALTVALTVAAFSAVLLLRKPPVTPVYTFKVAPPENTSYPGTPSVSPDGRYLVFSAVGPEGQRILWLRPLDQERSTPLAGTEGGFAPFWSPDSSQIAFFAGKMLRKAAISGGPVEVICPADARPGGGAWNQNGTIVFAPSLSDGLYQVPANGGKPEPLLKLNAAKSERSFVWPQFLPDNQHFLFYAVTDLPETTGVYLGSFDPSSYRFLFPSETNTVYSAMAGASSRKNGYLLFIHDRTLMGQVFDAANLSLVGDPITLRDDIGALNSLSLAPVSVSNNAVLVYQTVGRPTRQLVWMDREGKQIAVVKDPGEWGPPRISPDGSRAAVGKLGPDGKNADLWLVDADGSATQFTDTPAHEGSPVWSPDGTRLAFYILGKAEGNFDLYVKPVNGGKLEPIYKSDAMKYPTDWSRDGAYLLFTKIVPGAKADVWGLSLSDRRGAERRAGPILDTIHTECYAALSPDGRWLAYQSDESGRNEVIVQSFDGLVPGTKRRWTVSEGGGGLPRWRGDGKEIFYLTANGRMMVASVHPTDTEFQFDPPHMLFQTQPIPKIWNLYDVAPDGQRFLVNLPLELSNTSSIAVVTSWTEKLKD
jgi:Tol biopolymer transport system component